MNFPEPSIQLIAAKAAWVSSEDTIIKEMITQADHVLEYMEKQLGIKQLPTVVDGGMLQKFDWPEYAYMHLLNDGMFDPFSSLATPETTAYRECIEENGNADDETIFLSCCWCGALAVADYPKYAAIIYKIMDIAVNGL